MRGARVGVTATRRSVQLMRALELRGATVVVGPMLSGDEPVPDAEIAADTATILSAGPTWVVATTQVGMHLWLEAAERAGLDRELRDTLARARCVARGAKSVGGLRAAGVDPVWTSPRETDADVAGWLARRVLPGDTIAVQVHGGQALAYRDLAEGGTDLLTVMTYRSGLPADDGPARALIRDLVAGGLDLVTFTSPGAARNLYTITAAMGDDVAAAVRDQLAGAVAVAAVGPVTAEALEERGAVVTITPKRYRTGDLLRSIDRWWAGRGGAPDPCARASIRLRREGCSAVVDGREIALGGREFEILAMMSRREGTVFAAEELIARAWGHEAPADAGTVKHQIARLRRKLAGTSVYIETVRGVGYRMTVR